MGEGSPRLILVGTPIGNLGDVTPRASAAFAAADVVACEDTRRTGRLLQHLGIRATKLVRLDAHTEHSTAPTLIERISVGGEVVAVASDAGMPGLSDPGALIVRAAVAADVLIEVVPGPFAAAVALVGSGLLDSTGRFVFEGFLPRKGAERQLRLAELAAERRTVVLYEAPHRLTKTLVDLVGTLGPDRSVALCRELTKLHEETFRGSIADAVAHCKAVPPRGEYVIVIEGSVDPEDVADEALLVALSEMIEAGASRRDAAAAVASRFGVAPNRVKALLLQP